MLVDYKRNPLFGHTMDQVDLDYPQLLKAAEEVIQRQVSFRYRYYSRNRVDVVWTRPFYRCPTPGGNRW